MVGPRNGVEHPRVSQQDAGRMRHCRKPWQVISLVPRLAITQPVIRPCDAEA